MSYWNEINNNECNHSHSCYDGKCVSEKELVNAKDDIIATTKEYAEGLQEEYKTIVDGELENFETDLTAYGTRITNNENEISDLKVFVTPEMFGAVGDGVTDDTEAVQSCIDYSKNHNFIKVVFNAKKYLVSEPIKVYFNNDPYWQGRGTNIYGSNSSTTEIIKDTDSKLNNIDTVFYEVDTSGDYTKTGSGIKYTNIKITNNSESTESYCTYGKGCRGLYTHLSIYNPNGKGIDNAGWCNKFDDIEFAVKKHALKTSKAATGSVYTRLYAHSVESPYILGGNYSNVDLIHGDSCTGDFVTLLSHMGMNVGTIGAESSQVDNLIVVEYDNIYAETITININAINMFNLSKENANIFKIQCGRIKVESLYIQYNATVSNNMIICDFCNKKYGALCIDNFSYGSNSTTADINKITMFANRSEGNIFIINGTDYSGNYNAVWTGQQRSGNIYNKPIGYKSAFSFLGDVTGGTGFGGGLKGKNGNGDYQWSPIPNNNGLIFSTYSKSTNANSLGQVLNDTDTLSTPNPQNSMVGWYLPCIIGYSDGTAPSDQSGRGIAEFKRGTLFLNTRNNSLAFYNGTEWKVFTFN